MKCSNCGRHIRKKQCSSEAYRKMNETKKSSRVGKGILRQTSVYRRCPFCDNKRKKK